MRIGIDARELSGRATGVGRFLRGLLREWSNSSVAGAHEFVLYAPEPLAIPLDSRRFHTREVAGAAGTWWEQMRLPGAVAGDALDVLFAPAYTAPLRVKVPIVLAIYDLSYVAHPEWFHLREGIRRRWLTQKAADKAAAIVTLSEFSRGEIIDLLGVSAQRVHVIVPGIDRLSVKTSAYGDARVLYVGSIFNRRHVPDLIRAIATLRRTMPTGPNISLDIVGDDRTFPRENLDMAIATQRDGYIRWHRYVTDQQLLELYGRARAFAFLSEYEGLGMTPLEALAAGVPPVVYDTAVARESYADAALYVPVGDQAAVVRALERALFDEQTRAAILAAAPATLAKYDWPRAARETLAVIESATRSG
jgi:glycosyltransferase involved in cell wall biosynthesis